VAKLCRESQIAGLLGIDAEDEHTLPAYSSGLAAGAIIEEEEGDSQHSMTLDEEKSQSLASGGLGGVGDEDEDESGTYSPMDGPYPHHPSGLNRPMNRLTLDFGEGFDLGSASPDSPQSLHDILDIGSGVLAQSGSSSSLPLRDEHDSPRSTYI